MDPKPHHSESTSRRSGNRAGSNGADVDQRQPEEPLTDAAFERKLARERDLLSIEQERAATREAIARARTAENQERHARKTRRRKMWLESIERIARAFLPPFIAVAVVGLSVAALVIDPWLFSLNLLLAPLGVLAYLRSSSRTPAPERSDEGDGEPEDD